MAEKGNMSHYSQDPNMQQSYGNYPYYGQPTGYPNAGPAGPSNGYIPFYTPYNAPQIPPGPVPVGFDAAAYAPQPNGSSGMPRSQGHRRANTTPARNTIPLKSALKKNPSTPAAPAALPLERSRTNSFNRPSADIPKLGRPQKYSNPGYGQNGYGQNSYGQNGYSSADNQVQALHMFVSFHGYNELRLENITELALKELREVIWPLWPDGIESDVVTHHTCTVKLRNAPWDMGGPKALKATKFIAELWTLCSRRGYSFQTTLDTATSAPRLVFEVLIPNPTSEFFLAYFSNGGRRLTMIDPPQHIDYSLGAELKAILGRKVTTNDVVDENIRVIEVTKGNGFGGGVEPAQFLMHVLRIITHLNFHLDAGISLSRKGPLRLRSRTELLVFKGTCPPVT